MESMSVQFKPARSIIVALVSFALFASACSGGGNENGDAGGGSSFTSISGSVVGYPYKGTASVQAFAPNDGAQLLSGTLQSPPAPRVQGTLTPLDLIPASSFANPYFCNATTVSPRSLRTTGVIAVGVADSGGVFGLLVRATTNDPYSSASVGDRLHGFVVATSSGSVSGNCVVDGLNATYDIDLDRGWNDLSARIDAVDSLGQPVAVTYTSEAPLASATWYYSDLPSGAGLDSASDSRSPVLRAIQTGFPVFAPSGRNF